MTKLEAPAAQRNKDPIWRILHDQVLPKLDRTDGTGVKVLEIAAGTGVHTQYFSSKLSQLEKNLRWYPTDPEASSRASIQAYIQDDPTLTDVVNDPLPLTLNSDGIVETPTVAELEGVALDIMVNINMIHISPWEATIGLMKLAGQKLKKNGILYVYGPYKVNGQFVDSNRNFDQMLQQRDPAWGVRELNDVVKLAQQSGLERLETIEMPANNLSVIYRKL